MIELVHLDPCIAIINDLDMPQRGRSIVVFNRPDGDHWCDTCQGFTCTHAKYVKDNVTFPETFPDETTDTQQPTIDVKELRGLVSSADSSIQKAIDALSPIYRDAVLSQVMMDLGKAMEAITEMQDLIELANCLSVTFVEA